TSAANARIPGSCDMPTTSAFHLERSSLARAFTMSKEVETPRRGCGCAGRRVEWEACSDPAPVTLPRARALEAPMTVSAFPHDHAARLERSRLALDGLSVGDALGETCFRPENWNAIIEDPRATARGPWPYTDDTTMAVAIFEVLDEFGRIDQDALARRVAARYRARPWPGEGGGGARPPAAGAPGHT